MIFKISSITQKCKNSYLVSFVFLWLVDAMKWAVPQLSLAIYFTVATLAAEQELDSGAGDLSPDSGSWLRHSDWLRPDRSQERDLPSDLDRSWLIN